VSARRQGGAALVVGLVLLVILTLLAVAGMSTSTTELLMAGNEQFRRTAAQSATAGIEEAIAAISTVPTSPSADPTEAGRQTVDGSTVDRYDTRTRFVDTETGLPQSSADKFVGFHFEIESDGASARNARDRQVQGVMVVAGAGGGQSVVGQIGTGLE
jgi:type IV pilus assembly protein PilX